MNIIVAVDKNWGIGYENKLLTSIPEDMKFFRETTMGKVVVMGRKTLESFPNGLPLKNRTNIVLTRRKNYDGHGAIIVHDEDELMKELEKYDSEDIFVIGGQSIYEMLMPYTSEFIVTRIDKEMDADVYFPNLDKYAADGQVKVAWESEEQTDEKTGTKYKFVRYTR